MCCKNCFSDILIKDFLQNSAGEIENQCSFCNSFGVELIAPNELKEKFEMLLECYEQMDDGEDLIKLLIQDWNIFSPELNKNMHGIKSLLTEILDDGEIVRKKYKPKLLSGHGEPSRIWENFCSELKHSNRYFPNDSQINFKTLQYVMSHLITKQSDLEDGANWFRARLQHKDEEYTAEDMQAPPQDLATHGRANPAGIPYFYLASSADTAITEIRPHVGEKVTLADVIFKDRDYTYADFRNPKALISPFLMEDSSQIIELRHYSQYLQAISLELRRAILPRTTGFDYVPSQYLCEYIKKLGYDGVIYQSAIGDGFNLALFSYKDYKSIEITNLRSIQIKNIKIDY